MVKDDFFWIGGALWLDLVNTEKISAGARVELLPDFAALAAWLEFSGALGNVAANDFASLRTSAQQTQFLESARDLRAILRRLCEKIHENGAPDEALVARLNGFLESGAPLRLEADAEKHSWILRDAWDAERPQSALFVIARAAAQTLERGEARWLRPCANPACILWFLDSSKNRSRRWCSMEGCGNRAKVGAHLARRRAG